MMMDTIHMNKTVVARFRAFIQELEAMGAEVLVLSTGTDYCGKPYGMSYFDYGLAIMINVVLNKVNLRRNTPRELWMQHVVPVARKHKITWDGKNPGGCNSVFYFCPVGVDELNAKYPKACTDRLDLVIKNSAVYRLQLKADTARN